MGVFGRIRESLSRTKQQIVERFDEIVRFADAAEQRSRPIDVDTIEALEELLIMVVRTGWPWDEEGEPNGIFRTCRDGYATAMVEAKDTALVIGAGVGYEAALLAQLARSVIALEENPELARIGRSAS